MAIDIRVPTPDDVEALLRRDEEAFGEVHSDARRSMMRDALVLERFRVAVDGDDIVGVAGSHAKQLTLPGGAQVDIGGTTWVSVAPTHRRQGVLRRMLDHVHADIVERGEPAAALLASEGSIYERFGYGIATRWRVVEIDRRRAQIDPRFVPASGGVRLVDPLDHVDRLAAIFERHQRRTVGEVSRDRAWIERNLRVSDPGLRCALHDDGYALWRITPEWGEGQPAHELRIVDLVAATPEAHVALWHVVLSHDLVGPIRCRTSVSPDDPLPYLLTDQRALRTVALNDMLWLCPIDVGALLSARQYRIDAELVIEVIDGGLDASASCERWAIGAGGAVASDAAAELTMTTGALGALLLGGVTATELAGGRRVVGAPDAVRRADLLFGWSPAPHCTTGF